jgi:RNA polymerase sigma-70 factor (ECF subfamily)
MDATDHEFFWTMLMEQAIAGDEFAYHRMLAAIAVSLTRSLRGRASRSGLDIEDIVQDVLLALHLKRATWVSGTPVAPWVTAIARNKIVDAWRRHARRPQVSLDSVVDTLRVDVDPRDELSGDLERGIAALTPRQREVLTAVSLQGCTSMEAARRLDISEGAVRVTMHRAFKSLAVLFAGRV